MKRLLAGLAVLGVLSGYVWLAAGEAADREASRPASAPVGVTFDHAAADPRFDLLAAGGFDFVALTVTTDEAAGPELADTVGELKARAPGLPYAFFMTGGAPEVAATALDALASRYARGDWFRFRGRPLVYTFGDLQPPEDSRFTFININNSRIGDQFWVADPPEFKRSLLTVTPSFTGRTVSIDPSRTGAALDRQESFARSNRDRVDLLLWHSWNVFSDGSAIVPHDVPGSPNPSDYVYGRVKEFNAGWKRP